MPFRSSWKAAVLFLAVHAPIGFAASTDSLVLQERMKELEEQVTTLRKTVGQSNVGTQRQITDAVRAMESRLGVGRDNDEYFAALRERIDALEQMQLRASIQAKIAESQPGSMDSKAFDTLAAKVAAIQAQVPTQVQSALAPLQGRIAALESAPGTPEQLAGAIARLKRLEAQAAATKNAGPGAALTTQVEDLSRAVGAIDLKSLEARTDQKIANALQGLATIKEDPKSTQMLADLAQSQASIRAEITALGERIPDPNAQRAKTQASVTATSLQMEAQVSRQVEAALAPLQARLAALETEPRSVGTSASEQVALAMERLNRLETEVGNLTRPSQPVAGQVPVSSKKGIVVYVPVKDVRTADEARAEALIAYTGPIELVTAHNEVRLELGPFEDMAEANSMAAHLSKRLQAPANVEERP